MKYIFLITTLFIYPARLEAKIIRSNQDLKFFEMISFDRPSRYLGFTSSKLENVVEVPLADSWYIRPDGRTSESEYVLLFRELKEKRFPGLDLSDRWDVDNKTLSALENTSSLKILRLSNTRISDEGLSILEKLPSLEILALNNQTTNAGLKHLKTLKRLRALELHRSRVTDGGLEVLKDLPRLEMLDLSDSSITDAGAKTLATLTSLRQLDISGTKITDKGLAHLQRLPKLEVLYTTSQLSDRGLASVVEIKRLKSLDVSGARLTASGLGVLPYATNLEALALSDTGVGDDAMIAVASLKKLKTLELSGTRVTHEGLTWLSQLPRLETLSVSWTELSSAEIRALSEVKRLERIILNGRTVDREVLARVRGLSKDKTTARIVSPKMTPPNTEYKTMSPAAPSSHPGAKNTAVLNTWSSKPPPTQNKTYRTSGLPKDVSPSALSRAPIALGGDPTGKGMIIEVGARPADDAAKGGKRLRGLKRLHHLEISQAPEELGLQPGAEPVIGNLEPDPKNSLGEITIQAR